MKYIISVILAILTFSCKTAIKDDSSKTYFGGEIINPKTNFVLFLKDDKVMDTLLLDNNNRFITEFKGLEEGLYTFKHGIEFQYIYLEPRDSVLVRLNSWDFDESIVFSGKGSSKNEFLINLFLQNEKEDNAMYHYFSLKEQDFNTKIDSLEKERLSIYKEFSKNEKNISKGFNKLTNTAIHYPLYRLKEVYPYYYQKAHHLNSFPGLSSKFYNFRNKVNLEEQDLVSFYPYQNYIVSFLYNLSYQETEKQEEDTDLTISILNNIIANIKLEGFKNTLLKRVVINDFLKSNSTCTINNKVLEVFKENCSNEKYITQVTNLVNDSKVVSNKKPLPNFKIKSDTTSIFNISDVIKDQNSVIYFWSTEFMSTEYVENRINYLKNKYPTILFVGINMEHSSKNSKLQNNLKKLDKNSQFNLTKDSAARHYLTSNYPRIIIVNNKGIVQNGFTYLNSRNLGFELNKLEKNQ